MCSGPLYRRRRLWGDGGAPRPRGAPSSRVSRLGWRRSGTGCGAPRSALESRAGAVSTRSPIADRRWAEARSVIGTRPRSGKSDHREAHAFPACPVDTQLRRDGALHGAQRASCRSLDKSMPSGAVLNPHHNPHPRHGRTGLPVNDPFIVTAVTWSRGPTVKTRSTGGESLTKCVSDAGSSLK
jgi:hypothetical protein